MKSGIYKIINLVTNKVYVGSSSDLIGRSYTHFNDLSNGNHHSIKLQRSYNKHGRDTFIFEIIELCEIPDLIKREQFYIDTFDSYKLGYNSVPFAGSNLGMIHSDETKEKIRQRSIGNKNMLGKHHNDNTKEKIKSKLIGNKLSEETKLKMSESQKGRKHTKETKEKISILNSGKKRTQEQKDKISESKTGKKQSSETIQNRSKSNTGKKRTQEQKDRMSKSMKGIKKIISNKVIDKNNRQKKRIAHISENGDIIKEYDSVTDCSLELSIPIKRISSVLTGKSKMYKKMIFVYIK